MAENIPTNEQKMGQRINERLSETHSRADSGFVFTALLATTALLLGAVAGYVFGFERGRRESHTDDLNYLLGAEVQSYQDELYLRNIIPYGPSYMAGVSEGAKIIAVGSEIDPDLTSFQDELSRYDVGDTLLLTSEIGYAVQQHAIILGVYGTIPYPLPVDPPVIFGQSLESRLGVYYRMLNESDALGVSQGALIITAGSPIADAGAQIGDIITEIGGVAITSNSPLDQVLNRFSPGERVEVRLYRAGEALSISVRLANE